jgi:pimeloyl-ACP methyl ester carboxylesterase
VIVCHGFGSCKENHATFAEQAAAQGFVTLTFDFRGHGASEGCLDSRTVNDIGAALAYLRADAAVDPARIAVRGSSMGGYFALHAAARWPELAAVVAICPATETFLSELLRDLQDPTTPLGQARRENPGVPRVMICDLGCWLDRAEVAAAAAQISPRPLLIIHCTGDEVIPASVSSALYAAAGEPKTLWLLDGGDHRFAQHDPATTARLLAWLHGSEQ